MKKIAFLVLAHADPDLFGRLCDSLDSSWCDVYVHIDKNINVEPFQAKAKSHDHICFVKDRFPVKWADISMISAQNALIRLALARKDQYLHCIFLSGSCYPIKPIHVLHKMLQAHPTTEFIKYIDMRSSPDHYLKQVTTDNIWSDTITPYFGSQWCALTLACCEFIIEYQNQNPWFWDMNIKTFSPDEHFYHSIVGNSRFASLATGIQEFVARGTWRMANLHIIHPSLSKYYTFDDFQEICSSNKFFVRKVRSEDGASLIDAINSGLILDQIQ